MAIPIGSCIYACFLNDFLTQAHVCSLGSDYSDQEPREEEESFGDKDEDVYVEDVEELPGDPKAKDQVDEEDIDVDEEGDEEDESKDWKIRNCNSLLMHRNPAVV